MNFLQKNITLLLLTLFVLLNVNKTWADGLKEDYLQEEISPHHFDEEQWKKATAGIDFSDAKKSIEENKKKEEKRKKEPQAINSDFWVGFLKFFLIAVGIGVVALLLVHFIGAGNIFRPRSKKINPTAGKIKVEEIEENIHEADFDHFILKATQQKDYVLVIRLYYLAILKELSTSKQIKWKKDKTNKDYLREMSNSLNYQDFKKLTRFYERAWYGHQKLNQNNFQQLIPEFKKLLNTIKAQSSLLASR